MATPWICRACRSSLLAASRRRISTTTQSIPSKFFKVSEEVQQAVHERRPVVALETTIYTHGFPYPENLALASRLESLVRLNGGVPATVGVLDGVARVGLGADELVQLVSLSKEVTTLKLSRRDLGFVLGLRDAQGKHFNGGTTISGTMVLAHLAGIKVFATGGLGGVHRGAEENMDISADLTELGRTPVAVISSGCKAFLDIPKTLEYLETQGVAVATFGDGRSGDVDFPAFYTRDSGVKSPVVLRDEIDAAKVLFAHHALGLQSGLHFANPIPEKHSLPFRDMELAIAQALDAAKAAGASGAAITPYVLDKIKQVTGSKSVEANKALVEANVIRGTKVAVELRKLELNEGSRLNQEEHSHPVMVGPAASSYTQEGLPRSLTGAAWQPDSKPAKSDGAPESSPVVDEKADVFVAGSLAVDLSCDYSPSGSSASPELQTSNPARIAQTLGGVGHNVARAAHLMGARVRLCSAVGDDLAGKAALKALVDTDMTTTGITELGEERGCRTAQYVAVNDRNKDLVLAMADMSILEGLSSSSLTDAFDETWLPQLNASQPTHLAVDANWHPSQLARWLQAGAAINAHITFEPVSNAKSASLFKLPDPLPVFPSPALHLATPNSHELAAMYSAARERHGLDRQDWWAVIDALGIPATGARVQMSLATSSRLVDEGIPQQSIQLLPFIPSILTKLGAKGVLLTQLLPAGDPRLSSGDYAPHILSRAEQNNYGVGGVYMRLFPAAQEVKKEDVVSVNGVGDTFVGTLLAGLASQKRGEARVEDFVDLAQRAAVLTLKSHKSVSDGLGTLRMLL